MQDALQQVMDNQDKKEELETENFEMFVAKRLISQHERALRRGKEFNMSFNHMKKLLKKKRCAYTNVAFSKTDSNLRLTIDRIDSNGPYSGDNTVAVTVFANNLKNQLLEMETSSIKTDIKTLKCFVDSLIDIKKVK